MKICKQKAKHEAKDTLNKSTAAQVFANIMGAGVAHTPNLFFQFGLNMSPHSYSQHPQ